MSIGESREWYCWSSEHERVTDNDFFAALAISDKVSLRDRASIDAAWQVTRCASFEIEGSIVLYIRRINSCLDVIARLIKVDFVV